MESGRNQQQPAEITELLRYYNADQADIDRLAILAASADQQTWWAPWTAVVPDWLRTFVGLEGLASRVTDYATAVMPALLQTEEYSLGVTQGSGRVRPDHSERTVNLRMERQRRLYMEANPVHLTAFIEESVLDRPVGTPETMRAQFEHLLSTAKRENVELRVLPTSVGAHDGFAGPFTLLEFTAAQAIVYVELVDGAVYVQDQEQIGGYEWIVARLYDEYALSEEDTIKAIQARLDAY